MNTETPLTEIPVPESIAPQNPMQDLTVDTSDLLKCYGILCLGMPLTFVRMVPIALVGLFMVVNGAFWGSRMHKRAIPLITNHARWIKRSFWLSTLYGCFAATLWWMIFTTHADRTGMDWMMEGMQKGTLSPSQISQTLEKFYAVNRSLILYDWIGCFTPVVLHAVLRFIKGYRRADAGLPIENVRTWWI